MYDFIPLDLHDGIKSYTYAVDLKAYVQKAIDYCVLNNKKLNVPAGGYLVATNTPIYLINTWGESRNLIIEGAGQGLSVFKEADGATNLGGRFTKMFYLYYGSSSFVGAFGHIKISGMSFDKNARNNVAGSYLYEYEQAHIIGGAGSGAVTIKSLQLENVEFIDKIGAGLNLSSAVGTKIRKVSCSNVFSRKHSKILGFDGDGTFGHRGCLEFGTNIDTLDINNCDVLYAQIEPVIPSSPTLQRSASVSGGKIDVFEWTDKGGYSFANVVNLTSMTKFLVRGVNANITNSTLKVPEVFAGGIIKITGGSLYLTYNSTANTVTAFTHGTVSGYTGYSELWLSSLNILIDSADDTIRPTGVLLNGGTVGLQGSRKRFINNVKFDARAELSIDAYGNGDWKVLGCDLQGTLSHIYVGGTGESRGGNVELINNTYSGTGSKVKIYKNNSLWTLSVVGTYPLANFYTSIGATDYNPLMVTKPTLVSATKPTTATAPIGQTVINTAPVAGVYEKWVKIADANTGASWQGIGIIEGVTTSGTTANRPTGVAVGYTYFDTTLGKPVYFKSTGVWVDSAGATV